MSNVFMVEVKFRRRFDKDTAKTLHAQLAQQLKHWPQTYAVIMVAEPFRPEATYYQDYIRVLKPEEVDGLVDARLTPAQRWETLHHLQRIFKCFNNNRYIIDVQKSADTLTQTLRDLAKLEPII